MRLFRVVAGTVLTIALFLLPEISIHAATTSSKVEKLELETQGRQAGRTVPGAEKAPSADVSKLAVLRTRMMDDGDSDGYADTGETVDVELTLANFGDTKADAVFASLMTWSDDLVEIVIANVVVPDLEPGEERIIPAAFTFRVLPSVQRKTLDEMLIAEFQVVLSVDTRGTASHQPGVAFGGAVGNPNVYAQRFDIDLDLDVIGGQDPTVWFEGFESGNLGGMGEMNLDAGKHSPQAADGYRCSYSDPDNPLTPSFGHEVCTFGASVTHTDEYHWQIDDTRSFSGSRSLNYGIYLDAARGYTLPFGALEAVTTIDPIHVGTGRVCSTDRSITCDGDFECPKNQVCESVRPELSFMHHLDDIDGFLNFPVLRAIVQAQVLHEDATPVGPWFRLEPSVNGYDRTPAYSVFNCSLDPIDDGSTEDDLYPSDDPRALVGRPTRLVPGGRSSTCHPQKVFMGAGKAIGDCDPEAIRPSNHGPGLCGNSGPGTWVESRVSLERLRGRSIRVRFLFTSVAGHVETFEDFFAANPFPGDDGWWIDNLTVTDATLSPGTVRIDTGEKR